MTEASRERWPCLLSVLRFEQGLKRVGVSAGVCARRQRLEGGVRADLEGLVWLHRLWLVSGLVVAAVQREVGGADRTVALPAMDDPDRSLGRREAKKGRGGVLGKHLIANVHDRVDAARNTKDARRVVGHQS